VINRSYDAIKRFTDLMGALVLLVLLAPLLLLLCAVVRFGIGSPVLFRQTRPGLRGRPFKLIKFRTMLDARDEHDEILPDKDRLTPFGRWLRRSSLDELPEIWCVLVGTMSFVGPRPLLMEYLPRYSAAQARRHEVRPGITGWAQVNGRNAISWDAKFALDLWYVEHRSIALDLRIVLRTARSLPLREGISATGEATMPRFMGSGDHQSP
jgi:lipopolysaccharide/colanic/teichoic acid biosynthesis glycosyltransferase